MKAVFIIFISFLTINLMAQDAKNFKRISTGVKVGTELGFLGLESSNETSNSNVALGYSILVDFIEYQFSEQFSANIGIGFTSRNYQQSIDNVQFIDILAKASAKEHLLVQNIEIPLTARYYLKQNGNNRQYYLLAGSTLYYNLHHNSKQEIFFSDGTIWEYNNQKDIKRTTFAATFGAGFQFDTNYRLSYIIEPIIQINPNEVSFYYGRNAKNLVSLGLMAGVKF